jgi:predicted ATP-dependent endonuclease of OLD family
MIKTNRKIGDISDTSKSLIKEISDISKIQSTDTSNSFRRYVERSDIGKILLELEASGFQKLALLFQMLSKGWLESGSILLWDEPENSFNPELIPVLVDILLELSRNGVQIFAATHSELLANEFSISKKDDDSVKFFSLYKGNDGTIKADTDSRFDLLEPNKLTEAVVKQYKREIERGLGGNG